MKESLSKDVLFDFFDGRTTSIQRKLVEDWLADPQNEELYHQYLDEWESRHPQFSPQIENALSDYIALMNDEDTGKEIPLSQTEVKRSGIWKTPWLYGVAAACLLMVVSFVFRNELMYRSLESENGRISEYKLSDGTNVVLNANSVLRVPRLGFGSGNREVMLDGEAEFKVVHTESDSRFIVKMNKNYLIEVLGTEFVAFSRERGTKVFLTKGKVKLSLPKGKQLYMKPGNLFSTEKDGKFTLTSSSTPGRFVAWKQDMFYFDNTLLSEAVEQLNDRFKVDVRILDPVLGKRRIGGVYKAKQADDLLAILSELLHLEVVKHNEFIELRPSVTNPNHE
ncbi:FecR domain-containing protein [Dyadobacter sp. LJ53]|uniref:FecR family protein n=1 Tax=Dyadobacter chenwenxiniae TaxID=2906456 RepID=UPI001F1FAEE6|nr:FecR domain-containing protein [Dyadobacter chenwenxiniae]MCF0049129.1 FecR domain-containing protein [Dyadobacter chenwenxiniae]